MKEKSLGLAAIALTCAVGLAPVLSGSAIAQSANFTPDQLRALIRPGVPAGSGRIESGGAGAAGAASPAISTGWNYGHCYASWWYTPDNTNYYEYAFNIEGTAVYYGINSTFAQSAQNQLREACASGHQWGWYVTNASTGAYIAIQVGF